MRRIRGSCLALLVSALVLALVLGPGLPAAHASPPAFRYTLADGTVLVGVPLAEEEDGTLTIETSVGVVRVPKAKITSIVLADAPQTSPPPTRSGSGSAVLIPAGDPPRRRTTKVITAGAGTFALFWLGSALASSVAIVGDASDRDALYGFVPVGGPMIWANRTESKRGLGFAILDGIFQAGGLLTVGTGLILRQYEDPPKGPQVLISPHFGEGQRGISVSVPF